MRFLKNKLLTVITLLLLLITCSSVIIWLGILSPENTFSVSLIHNKLGQLFVILAVIHIIQHFKWLIMASKVLTKM